jgi:hypothetical protein
MPEMSNSNSGDNAVHGYHWPPLRKGKPLSSERRAQLSAAAKEREARKRIQAPATEQSTNALSGIWARIPGF